MRVWKPARNAGQIHVMRPKRTWTERCAPHPAREIHASTHHCNVYRTSAEISRSETDRSLEKRRNPVRTQGHRIPAQINQSRGTVTLQVTTRSSPHVLRWIVQIQLWEIGRWLGHSYTPNTSPRSRLGRQAYRSGEPNLARPPPMTAHMRRRSASPIDEYGCLNTTRVDPASIVVRADMIGAPPHPV